MASAGHAGLTLGPLERAGLDGLAVGLEAGRGARDEGLVGEAGVDDLAGHGVGQRDVRADVESEPEVRPLGRAGAPRVDDDDAGAVADAAQEVMEEDRMRLPGVAAPQEHEVRLLDLTI